MAERKNKTSRRARQIRVLYCQPGGRGVIRYIPDKLGAYQALVGGPIEAVRFADDIVLLCNEEGRLRGLPFNVELVGVRFVGPILMVGVTGEEFSDFPLSYDEAVRLFPALFRHGRAASKEAERHGKETE